MNIAQILRLALFNADFVNVDGTTHRVVTEPELLAWAQTGHDKILAKLRETNEDYGLVFRSSTDSSLRWNGITYAPSSFALTTTGRTYTLPPDLVTLRRIRALTAGYEGRRFVHKDLADPYAVEKARVESTETESGTIYWDVIGERTLYFPQPPDVALDIEIAYIAQPPQLRLYSAGTISVTQDTDAVTGGSTLWVDNELSTPMELMAATGSVAPKIVSQTSTDPFVDPSSVYAPVSTITTDTALTLMGNWLTASVSSKAYLLASVPSVPRPWQWVLARWVTAMIRWKTVGAPVADQPDFDALVRSEMIPDVSRRQTADADVIEDFDPGDSEWA